MFGIQTSSPVILMAAVIGAAAWHGITSIFKRKKRQNNP